MNTSTDVYLDKGKIIFSENLTRCGVIWGSKNGINIDKSLCVTNSVVADSLLINYVIVEESLKLNGDLICSNVVEVCNKYGNKETGIIFERTYDDIITDDETIKGIILNNGVNNLLINSHDNIIFNKNSSLIIKIIHDEIENSYEVRTIVDYKNSIIVLDKDLDIMCDSGEIFCIYTDKYTGLIYDKEDKQFIFRSLQSTEKTSTDIQIYTSNIRAKNGIFDSVVSAIELNTVSDKKFKTDIKLVNKDEINNIIKNLEVVKYKWNREKFPKKYFDNKEHIGLIAQDVEKVIPSIVHTDKDGHKSISYNKLTPILLDMIKQLENRVVVLEKEINNYKFLK
jgi:hypothetical protein